jgi:hypothetical protein
MLNTINGDVRLLANVPTTSRPKKRRALGESIHPSLT